MLPSGVTTIQDNAFTNLYQGACMEIELPATITTLYTGAFVCEDMHVIMYGQLPSVYRASGEGDYYDPNETKTCVVFDSYLENYIEVYYDYAQEYEDEQYSEYLYRSNLQIMWISAPEEWFQYEVYDGVYYIYGIDWQNQDIGRPSAKPRGWKTAYFGKYS